jgi:hypothetical protein
MEEIINDISICVEAINNNDLEDAIQMLKDIQEDLKIISLMC